MGASDALENQIITRLIDGNGYLVSPDTTYYLSLHATDPGDTGTGELAAVNGYSRKSYTTSGGWNAAASGSTSKFRLNNICCCVWWRLGRGILFRNLE